MGRAPVSVLSMTDFNGRPLRDDIRRASFQKLMEQNGYVYACNVPDEFDHVAFCKELGDFVPQYTGVIVGDVMPEEGMDDVYHAGNTKPLTPHTEGYDFEVPPPRYIALWCVTPARGSGGETTLADAYELFATFDEEERRALRERSYRWKTTDGVLRMGLELETEHPVLEETPDGTIVRFSCNNLLHDEDDELIPRVIDRVKAFFDAEHVAADYDRNDMLVWDNWRMFHARNGFTDRGRHLKRIQIA